MKSEREYINFLRSFYDSIDELEDEDRLKMYDAIFKYSFEDGYEPDFKGINKSIWMLIKPILDKSFINYKNRKKTN